MYRLYVARDASVREVPSVRGRRVTVTQALAASGRVGTAGDASDAVRLTRPYTSACGTRVLPAVTVRRARGARSDAARARAVATVAHDEEVARLRVRLGEADARAEMYRWHAQASCSLMQRAAALQSRATHARVHVRDSDLLRALFAAQRQLAVVRSTR